MGSMSWINKNFIWNLQKLSTQTVLVKARDSNKRPCLASMKSPHTEFDFQLTIPPAFAFSDEGFLSQ